ncbi:MAG: hypothetical protein AAGH89_12910 [Verrucomicrobiota bacterium]
MPNLQSLAENLWLMPYPLSIAGMRLGRTVTIIRLRSGKLIIHSTAPFPEADVAAFTDLGEPTWLVEATNFHDTFARQGHAAFPQLPYLVPEHFPTPKGVSTQELMMPDDWGDELSMVKVDGMPKINEHVFFHPSSKTLIVADLVFNMPPETDAMTLRLLRWISGMKTYPDNSRMYRALIKDRAAFEASLQQILAFDFETVIVAHGVPIRERAKDQLAETFRAQGFAV